MIRRSLRRWSYGFVAILVGAAGLWFAPTASASSTVVFVSTGATQTWTVPSGVTAVEVTMVGGGGGGGRAGTTASGGGGGAVTGILTVEPGDTLSIIVGQGGINSNVSSEELPDAVARRNYRFGGGGAGAGQKPAYANSWGSGGGRTALRSSSSLYGTSGDLLTAGAGGGGGYAGGPAGLTGAGGAGGGLIGGDGGGGSAANTGGDGGTQLTGGAGGQGSEPGVDGIQFAGGYAQLSLAGVSEGGGGGGGYYGGGGAGDNGGGGGGSSYLGLSSYFTGSTTAGSGATPGLTSWPSECGTTPGQGGTAGASTGPTDGGGGNGCLVIDYNPYTPGAPPPWLQAYARPEAGSDCSTGWNPSWAEWPSDNRGGYTCERRLQYVGGMWVYFAGFPG